MKPPRSVWVLFDAENHPWSCRSTEPCGDLWIRYVLPTKPRGRKPRKRKGAR